MSYDEYADEAAYAEQMAAYANEVEAQLEDECRAGLRVRYIGEQFGTTHGGEVGTVMKVDSRAGLKWVQFDDDTIAPQGWFPAADLEEYAPTKIVEDPNIPVDRGVIAPEDFGVTPKRLAELSGELSIRQMARRAFEAGHRLGHWEPGISGDPLPYEDFDQWWEGK